MPKTEPQFCRDAKAIALVWGIKLAAGLPRKLKQLEAIRTVMARPDFPRQQKTKGGLFYSRAEVSAFGKQYVAVTKKFPMFELKEVSSVKFQVSSRAGNTVADSDEQVASIQNSKFKIQNSEMELPARPGADPGELFPEMTPEEIAAQKKWRLDYFQDVYLHPGRRTPAGGIIKLNSREEDELRAERPYLFKRLRDEPGGGSDDGDSGEETFVFDKRCNLKRLCAYYKKKFEPVAGRAIKVYPQMVNHWQEGRGGLPAQAPFHPPPESNGSYATVKCFDWFESWILPKYKRARTPELPGVPESEPMVDITLLEEQEARDQILFNRWERAKEQGEYVHKTVALATGVAAVKRIHLLVKTEDERNLPKMRREKMASLGMAAGLIEQFSNWDIELARSITDKRELAMELAGREMQKPEKAV